MLSFIIVGVLTTAVLWFARGVSIPFGYGTAFGILYGVLLMTFTRDKSAALAPNTTEGRTDRA